MHADLTSDSRFRQPYNRMPMDFAYGVLYLAPDESKFVTGSQLVIDEGHMAQRRRGGHRRQQPLSLSGFSGKRVA